MIYKPGFIYMRSASLGQMIAYGKKSGCVFCEDKTSYSAKEIQLFCEAGMEVDMATHIVKKIFNGEVVQIERDFERNAEAERIEGSEAGGAAIHPVAGGSLSATTGESADGELGIY
jgi:hypothetical protein